MTPAKRPGRVVMLVDNTIDGDSRVQKSARAMADAGWEVHLLGKAPVAGADEYEIGQAQVHRIPLKHLVARKTLRLRLHRLRYPLAYPSKARSEFKRNQIEVDRAELQVGSIGAAARTGISAAGPTTRGLPFVVQRVAAKVRRDFIEARAKQTPVALGARVKHDGTLEDIEARVWTALMGDRAWRRLDPLPYRYEISYQAEIDRLKPDLIHAHDFRMIGVAARYVARARRSGRTIRLVYDAHEFVPGLNAPGKKWLAAQIGYEREHIGYADAVVTVSPALAEMLEASHSLVERPEVTLNAPPKLVASENAAWATESGARDVRAACGLSAEVQLAVYCGAAGPQRGLLTLVEALEFLPHTHAAFVTNNLDGAYVASLRKKAAKVGASDRVHFMPYVPYDVLVGFLSTADIGVHPLRKGPVNHEVALSTKFFEFMQARLPVVVSDVKAMADEVGRVGNGLVFRSEDTKDLARAVEAVLGDRERFRRPYDRPGMLDEWSWEAQTERYVALYERLLADLS
ncbi:glycosyltransferase family 4 protein [Streptomyces sp. A3M-1-3]|uniref:glycosyltransferase family 4 protein n=1 Tax=Streptomyces sp. A3M-1-3 TaxID=2962044 RepID=UPI0020B66B9B|nr:glycosyltransferase family 4 protein [Streptomyces sp. A3M-1-3]MCP3817702.1 glycosyltransferase family 4 protein [Streptomyces sp. A3M-1-3]